MVLNVWAACTSIIHYHLEGGTVWTRDGLPAILGGVRSHTTGRPRKVFESVFEVFGSVRMVSWMMGTAKVGLDC